MPRQLTLLLVRHGETAFNAEGRFQGALDIPLSDRGREQAIALQKRLASAWVEPPGNLPGPPVRIFSSPLSRAAETARILRQSLPEPPPIFETPLLQERSYGSWEGLTTREIQERFGAHSQPEDAEPFEQVRRRIVQAHELIWQETLQDANREVALVVGHGASLRYFFALALGIGNEPVRHIQMDNTGLSIVVFRGASPESGEGRLLLLNDTSHLAVLGHRDRPRATPPGG